MILNFFHYGTFTRFNFGVCYSIECRNGDTFADMNAYYRSRCCLYFYLLFPFLLATYLGEEPRSGGHWGKLFYPF